MSTREYKIERYLHKQIQLLGGTTRKWVSPGRNGVPDRIVIISGFIFFVETKTKNGSLSHVQRREHRRLRDNGAMVEVAYSVKEIDALMVKIKHMMLELLSP